MHRWDIYRAYINFEDDNKQGKNRPILIINVSSEQFIACKITSKYRDDELEYEIKDWVNAGLDTQSYVRLLRKVYLPPETQMIYLGSLQKVDIDDIKILCQKYDIKLNENFIEEKLIQSSSNRALQQNIKTEIDSGKSPKQAAAIAYSVQRKNESMNESTVQSIADEIVNRMEDNLKYSDNKPSNIEFEVPTTNNRELKKIFAVLNDICSDKYIDYEIKDEQTYPGGKYYYATLSRKYPDDYHFDYESEETAWATQPGQRTGKYKDRKNEDMNENNITNTLPASIDKFLMDIAQMYISDLSYSDIINFGDRASEADIKQLQKYKRELSQEFDETDPEIQELFVKIKDLVKGSDNNKRVMHEAHSDVNIDWFELSDTDLDTFDIEPINQYDNPEYYCVDTGEAQQVIVAVSEDGRVTIEEDTDNLGFEIGAEFDSEDEFQQEYEKLIDTMLDENMNLKEKLSLSELVKDSINHLVNDLGKDSAAEDFADDVISDIENNYDVDVDFSDPLKYKNWASEIACEVSRQLNEALESRIFLGNDYTFTVQCNDGPVMNISTVAETLDEAVKYAKNMYASSNSVYADDRKNKWTIVYKNTGEVIEEELVLREAGGGNYIITYYLNTASRERRPETVEDVKNDFREEHFHCESDFDAMLQAYLVHMDDRNKYDSAQDIIHRYDVDFKTVDDMRNYFDTVDIGDGSTIICKVEKNNTVIYDSGMDLEFFQRELDETLNQTSTTDILTETEATAARQHIIMGVTESGERKYYVEGSDTWTTDKHAATRYDGLDDARHVWGRLTGWGVKPLENFKRVVIPVYIAESVDEAIITEYNIGSDKLLKPTDAVYKKLEALAQLLEKNSANKYKYYVADVYEDYGAGMMWTTIMCVNPYDTSDRWQVLSTSDWLFLANGGSVIDTYQLVINDEYFQDKKKSIDEMNMREIFDILD